MGSWSKNFTDGSVISATDQEVAFGLSSWSRSRLDGMCGVTLSDNGQHIAISGKGDFWQSDDMDAEIGVDGPAKIVTRRIMKKLDSAERLMQILQTEHSTMLRVIDLRFGAGELLIADTL